MPFFVAADVGALEHLWVKVAFHSRGKVHNRSNRKFWLAGLMADGVEYVIKGHGFYRYAGLHLEGS